MKDTSWAFLVACVFAMFVAVLLVFGAPTGGGGLAGNGLVLARYAGFILGPLLLGLIVAGILWLANRVGHKEYLTPRRDLLVVAVTLFYFSLRGSHRLDQSGVVLVGLCCFLLVAFLLLRHRLHLPGRGALASWFLGACVVVMPLALIAASLWLINYTFFGATVLFVLGAVWLLRLSLRDSRSRTSGERT